MPKCSFAPRKEHRRTEYLYEQIRLEIYRQRLRQSDIAKVLHVKQNTVSYHLKNCSFDKDQLNTLLDFLGMEITVCVKSA